MDHFLLAFLGFPGNSGIKEEQGSARNPSQMPPESVKYSVLASLRASSPIWASELSLARTHEWGAFPLPLGASPLARAFTRDSPHSPKKASLLAGYLLAFQETPESRKSQGVPEIILVKSSGVFLHIRKSPESVENFVMAFRAFPGIPGEPGEPGHSWLFQAFS